jgi:Zn-dependent peptidase ImmA (M78 family)
MLGKSERLSGRRLTWAQTKQGSCFESNGKRYVCTNANDRPERQRFTVCHEVAHIRLGLASQHESLPWWSYAKRPLAEILCDVFAAELLLPYELFHPEAEKSSTGLSFIDNLAERFGASVTATGSRYAYVVSAPVAFVLSEQGKVTVRIKVKAAQGCAGMDSASPRHPGRFPLEEGARRPRHGGPRHCRRRPLVQ